MCNAFARHWFPGSEQGLPAAPHLRSVTHALPHIELKASSCPNVLTSRAAICTRQYAPCSHADMFLDYALVVCKNTHSHTLLCTHVTGTELDTLYVN